MNDAFHVPVMLNEAIEALRIEKGRKYIDATVGGGGHGWEIVRRGGDLLGIDVDRDALEFTRQKFEAGSEKLEGQGTWKIVQGNFRDIGKIAREHGFEIVDGVLFDLGVSSYHLDTPERGFSYRFNDAPLDMRLDQSKGITARELLQSANEETLYEIFAKFGEEEHSRAIALALVRARQIGPITSAGQVLSIIQEKLHDQKQLHATASRIFQALRIAVNDELSALREGLKGAGELLRHGGRIVVISFHSLEDRIVKQTMQSSAIGILTKKPILATSKEMNINSRARSAKLRAGEKL